VRSVPVANASSRRSRVSTKFELCTTMEITSTRSPISDPGSLAGRSNTVISATTPPDREQGQSRMMCSTTPIAKPITNPTDPDINGSSTGQTLPTSGRGSRPRQAARAPVRRG
jgi:hypothetical protein